MARQRQASELAGMECMATCQEEGEEGRQGKKLGSQRARVSCLRISAVYYVFLLGVCWWEDRPMEARHFGLPAVQGHRARGTAEGASGRWAFGRSKDRAENPQYKEEVVGQVGKVEIQSGRKEGSLGGVSCEVQGASRQTRRNFQDRHQDLRTGNCGNPGRLEQDYYKRSGGHGYFDKRRQGDFSRTEAPTRGITSPDPVSSTEDGSLCGWCRTYAWRISFQRQVPADEQAATNGSDAGRRWIRQVGTSEDDQNAGYRNGPTQNRGRRDSLENAIQGEKPEEGHIKLPGADGLTRHRAGGRACYKSRSDSRAAREFFRYSNQEGEGGATFQWATLLFFVIEEILECTWLRGYTESCHLSACNPLLIASSLPPARSEELIELSDPEAQSKSWGWTGFSFGFRSASSDLFFNEIVADSVNSIVLGACFGITFRVWTELILRTSLKGYWRRLRLSWWSFQLMALWGLHAIVMLRLIHFEGAHIRLEVVRRVVWLPIALVALVTAGRLSVSCRIDRIGRCRRVKSIRKPVSRVSEPGIRWKYLVLCFSLAFSHVSAVSQKLGYDLTDLGPENPSKGWS